MKVIGYIRVSTIDQEISVDFQRAQIVAFCAKDGLEYEIYQDVGISGSKDIDKREGLFGALNALGKGDIFLCYSLDRVARDYTLQITIERIIQGKKANLISVKGEGTGDENSPEKRLFKQMLALFAEFERELIRQRTKNALGQLKKNGKVYGPIPYGFKREGKELVPCADEQKTIDLILLLRDEPLSFDKIVNTLNFNKIKTRNGNKWQFKQVYNIIQNAGKETRQAA